MVSFLREEVNGESTCHRSCYHVEALEALGRPSDHNALYDGYVCADRDRDNYRRGFYSPRSTA
jgi:hypothetical protein